METFKLVSGIILGEFVTENINFRYAQHGWRMGTKLVGCLLAMIIFKTHPLILMKGSKKWLDNRLKQFTHHTNNRTDNNDSCY